ncbi:CO/xanthine dehydrogenase Mo-binding subunit [Bradyrhizobium diazoefficiens]
MLRPSAANRTIRARFKSRCNVTGERQHASSTLRSFLERWTSLASGIIPTLNHDSRSKKSGYYCAAIAEIEGTDDIRVRRLTLAVDVGEAINPDGVINQIEGGAIQATSWVLKERVRFDRIRITSTSWTDYPILTFSEVPAVDVEIIQRPEIEPVGAGEAAHGPVTAAIANAVHDCLGVRVRDLPITRDKIIAAMELAS